MEIVKFNETEFVISNGHDGSKDLWITADGMASLFEKDKTVINKHIAKIYKDKEVGKSTFRETSKTVQGSKRGVYKTKEYNLDVILSIGYKVNGKKGTEVRKFANKVLGEYIRKGVVVNEKVMIERGMHDVLGILNSVTQNLIKAEKTGLKDLDEVMRIIHDYGYSFTTLQKYDEGELVIEGTETHTKFVLSYEKAIKYIEKLKEELIKKGEATILFGQEKHGNGISFSGILGNIFQAFSWGDAYPSLEEKASHILYFIVKDHPFNDGNKRIASFLFSTFLQLNSFHLKSDGEKKINDNALAALVILIAESNPKEKDRYIKLLVNALRKR